jgi:hypothetical protein
MTRQENIAKAEDVRPFQQLGIGVQPSDEGILSLSCKKRKQRFNSWKSNAISQFTIDPGLQHFSLRFLSSYHKQPLHWRRKLDAFTEFMQHGIHATWMGSPHVKCLAATPTSEKPI